MQPLSLAILLSLAAVTAAQTSCPSAMPLSLCCVSLGPFSDNEYVWENVCGVTVPDTSLLTASGCESNIPHGSQEYQNMYAACCQEYLDCPSEDGAVAYNCTGTLLQ
ncbi:uncharacterized protein B0H18DRAFT_880182 [Fomitopsis serialis]|uniref:uncharacterized protein n=1 Tax=Fomitopsis serialis TaxID=139415 RepID=UPI002008741E|nr:uncharacterized protein B0H18DRAFT_880182 [Neoantrodia serialis]KAH9921403.1 hypothetical protein B0H18DRAFT_880182 [Neoantrodia serialis]